MTALSRPAATHAVVSISGGVDSTILAYWLVHHSVRLELLSFDYGQRHHVELQYARRTAERLGMDYQVIGFSGLAAALGGSALTDRAVGVPDGHYTDASMRATVVPNRNAIMLDVAVAVAIARGADAVAYGAHAGDHPIYPDCRPTFVDTYQRMVATANEGFLPQGFEVIAPFLQLSKAQIVSLGAHLGVPFAATWSCYRGADRHCGTCGTCVERREAFAIAGVADPTVYTPTVPGVE